MNKTNAKNHSAAGLDTAIIEDLRSISVIGVYENLSPVVSFVLADGLVRSFNNMLYFSAINDLGSLTRTAQQVSTVLDVINYVLGDKSASANLPMKFLLLEEVAHVNAAYTMLCSNLTLVYKIYGMRKPAVTVATTKILQCLVESKNSNLLSVLIDNFDFNQSAVQNILVPTRDDFKKKIIDNKAMRGVFVELWLSICSASNPTVRKDLLTNFKIMNNFWRYMSMERIEVINKILQFLDQYVCSEPAYRRATKCRILNENFLYNVYPLFAFIKSENDRQRDNDDIQDFSAFKLTLILFMNTLVSDTNKGITFLENEFGSPLIVNNVTFHINNKLIYTLLTGMKPWESHSQLQFVMQILNHNHELLPPYMHWIVSSSGGYHDPTLSSYWIGHTLLYTEILKSTYLPIKPDFVSLLPLSRNVLSECISFPSDMVKQLGLQLILLQLQKLSNAKKLLQFFGDYTLSNLPSHASFIPLLGHDNRLIKLTTTLIIALYEDLAPKFSSSAIVGAVSKELHSLNLGPERFGNFDLILLDMYLSIQSNNELKWWNKVPGDNSFFTSLLKFSNLPLVRKKILRILQKLTKPTLVFNEGNTIESPIVVLIETTASIGDIEGHEKLWACLDETISRAVSSPYKYLDRSHSVYGGISIFLVVLFEQINFIDELGNERIILQWLKRLITGMIIIGEPIAGLKKAGLDANVPITFDLANLKSNGKITSKYELAEAGFILDRVIQRNEGDTEIFNLMGIIGNFLLAADLSDSSFSSFVVSPRRWSFLLKLDKESITEHEILAACLFSEIIGQLGIDFANSDLRNLIFRRSLTTLPRKNQALLKRFAWILSDAQLELLASSEVNDLMILGAYEILIKRGVKFSPDLSKLINIDLSDVQRVLLHLEPSMEQINWIIQHSKFSSLLERGLPEMSICLLEASNLTDSLLYQIGSFYSEVADKYRGRLVNLALTMIDWRKSLKIFTAYPSFFNRNQIIDLVSSRPETHSKVAMNSTFVNLVNTLVTPKTNIPPFIKKWIHKAMLYVTKKFAESKSLSAAFEEFLDSLQKLLARQKDLRTTVPIRIINAQLEVLLASNVWSSQNKVLRYANHVILCFGSEDLASDKLLQIFVNNEKNALCSLPNGINSELRFQSSLLIYSLFHSKETASSTASLSDAILVFYLGSQRPDDLLLKDVLMAIEKNSSQSWVNQITNWDYQEGVGNEEVGLVGEDRLFIKDSFSFVVALNKKFLKNTIENKSFIQKIPVTKIYEDFAKLFVNYPSNTYQETVYDPEFLMVLIINNEELVREHEGKIQFNVNKLVDSEILRFIITSLACDEVKELAKIILTGVLRSLCDEVIPCRDKNIIKVYISSIMHTVRVADHSVPLVWYVMGSFSSILVNPGHHLYDRVHHFVLSTPVIGPHNIPLFHLINKDVNVEIDYHKSVTWLVEQILDGVRSSEDLQLLESRDVLEWILSIFTSMYASARLRLKVLKLLWTIQNIIPDGTDILMTKFAGLSTLEVIKRSASGDGFVGSQDKLNIDQIMLRIKILNNQKRVKEWAYGNIEHATKRIHFANI